MITENMTRKSTGTCRRTNTNIYGPESAESMTNAATTCWSLNDNGLEQADNWNPGFEIPSKNDSLCCKQSMSRLHKNANEKWIQYKTKAKK